MTTRCTLAILAAASAVLIPIPGALNAASPDAASDNWGERVARAERGRDSNIREVRSVRRYVLHNSRWERDAEATVLVTQDAAGKKQYQILDEKAEGLQKRVLSKILDGEVEVARSAENADISPANYELIPIRREVFNGRECVIVQLKPRRNSKLLIEGRAWIDVREAAPVRVEGRPSRSYGFWVGKPYIVQDFRKVGDFWLSSQNHSTADVKLIGKTDLQIDFLDYSVAPKSGHVMMACVRACSPHLLD